MYRIETEMEKQHRGEGTQTSGGKQETYGGCSRHILKRGMSQETYFEYRQLFTEALALADGFDEFVA